MDCSLPGFSIHGVLQARILKWVTISFSRGSFQTRDRTQVSCIAGRCFNLWALTLVAQLVKNLPAIWETWVQSLEWEDPLEKGKATHSSILAWRIPWTIQSELDMTESLTHLFHFIYYLYINLLYMLNHNDWNSGVEICTWPIFQITLNLYSLYGYSDKFCFRILTKLHSIFSLDL